MFFRRERPQKPTFAQRMDRLRQAGFTMTPLAGGVVRICRGEFAADLRDANGSVEGVGRAGILIGGEIGVLVDGGFQKFFQTPPGQKRPALADQLKALHDFEEDLREALGQETYYNEALGTVSTFYLYDRVKDRDHGVPRRAWE
jgi:hypothetical protein